MHLEMRGTRSRLIGYQLGLGALVAAKLRQLSK